MENSLFYSQVSPLNAERLLGLCNFKIFWESMPPETPRKCRQCRLLIQSVTLFKSAAYFNFYWNPWGWITWMNDLQGNYHHVIKQLYKEVILQSSEVNPTLQDSINEFVIRKLNPLLLLISESS